MSGRNLTHVQKAEITPRLPWVLWVLANLALGALFYQAQIWTNQHLFAHGSLFGPSLVIAGLCIALVGFWRLSTRVSPRAHVAALRLASIAAVGFWSWGFLMMDCQRCLASG